MKGKQLEFREPQTQTAEAEVPSVLLAQNKRTQHNTLQNSAWRGLPGKTPPMADVPPRALPVRVSPSAPRFPFPSRAWEGCRDHPEAALNLPVLGERKQAWC